VTNPVIPVILSGGSGTRLWPASREKFPKQFLALMGETTLLQETALRALRTTGAKPENIITVTLGEQSGHVKAQLEAVNAKAAGQILHEPSARNTAAAVAFAASHVYEKHGTDALMLVLPADHHINNEAELARAYALGLDAARNGFLVTFGIKPHRPETGYGYIRQGEKVADMQGILKAAAFVEKPRLEIAQSYIESGDYLWNSGMFVFAAGKVLEEFSRHSPAILAQVREAMSKGKEPARPDPAAYSAIPSEPFDKAIMERSSDVVVIPCDPSWSDIGSWESLWEIREKDTNNNLVQGKVELSDSTGCVVLSHGKRLVTCAGVSNVVVIDTGDTILVADRSNADSLKKLVSALRAAGNPHVTELPEVLMKK